MEVADKIEESCRLCDEISEKMFSVFDKNEEGFEMLRLIKECLPLIIYRTDPLSKQICESCFNNVNALYTFKKIAEETADRQKEKLKASDTGGEENQHIRSFLSCGEEPEEGSELKDAITSTEDLVIYCNNCKQAILDGSTVNGELELCTDLHKAIAESMAKNKVTTESASEKLLRKRKVVPFYHELEDSLCSSLTEFTHNTEGSQCYEMPSDMDESVDSDDGQGQRPSKRRRILEYDDENESGSGKGSQKPEINGNFESLFMDEEEYCYQPLSLLNLTLNAINRNNIPEYDPSECIRELIYPKCNYCGTQFQNYKLVAIHEVQHMDIEIDEKIDNPIPWEETKENAEVRNKWLNYFDENGYGDDDIVIDEPVNTESLLIPVDNKPEDQVSRPLTGDEQIVLVGTQPMVNGLYLGDYTKEERKMFYQSMRIQGVNKKFCTLCRYTFKDNWAIESHYFSSACYYTCRYCGMRFNKQRHKFTEHIEEHKTKKDDFSDKIYAASKISNIVPKVIHPPRVKKIVVTQHNPQPIEQNHNSNQSIRVRNLMERKNMQQSLQIKEEPAEPKDMITTQSKTGNQAYFCRKCYKVFFKLDEFNIHSKNCDYNQFPPMRVSKPMFQPKNGEVSPAGRPLRNCAKDMGPYKDEIYLPDSVLKEPKHSSPQTFVCFICNTPFPTIYSRNSHMRIHKGDLQSGPPSLSGPPPLSGPSPLSGPPALSGPMPSYKPLRPPQNNHQNYRTPLPQQHYQMGQHMLNMDMIKQEPMDMPMEPMVEIHEQESYTSSIGDGAVSITPISKNPRQRPTINPNVMRIVQSNPNLSIKRSPEKMGMASSSQMNMGVPLPDDNRSYKCSSCWEAFANKSHLYFHKKNQCEGSRLPCPFCKKRFGTEAEYSSHIYYSHPE